jgi:hypothetical protein
MASIYEDEILGAQQQRDLARKLRDTEVPSTGHMIGDWYVAPTVAQQLSAVLKQGIGAYKENQAEDEIKDLRNQRLKDVISAKQGLGMPASQRELEAAGTPAQKPSVFSRIGGALGIIDKPQGTPAVPMQQPPIADWSSQTSDQQMRHVLSASEVAPELTNTFAAYQKLKTEEAKNKQEALYKNIGTGFRPGPNGTIVPMDISTAEGVIPYDKYQIDLAFGKRDPLSQSQEASIANSDRLYNLAVQRFNYDKAHQGGADDVQLDEPTMKFAAGLIGQGLPTGLPAKTNTQIIQYMAHNNEMTPELIRESGINYKKDVNAAIKSNIGAAEQQRLTLAENKFTQYKQDKIEANKPLSDESLSYASGLISEGGDPKLSRKHMDQVYEYRVNHGLTPEGQINAQVSLTNEKTTEKAYSPQGKQGQAIIALATAGQHLNLMSGLADALQNNDLKSINSLSQTIAAQTGEPAPTNFDAAKRIVTGEIMKTVTSTGGGVEERKSLAADLDRANSPAQLKGVMNTYKDLLAGKVHALAGGYKSGTGKEFDYNRFGVPEWQPTEAGQPVTNYPPAPKGAVVKISQ